MAIQRLLPPLASAQGASTYILSSRLMFRRLLTFAILLSGLFAAHAQVKINEFMASNTRAYPDITDFEDYPDWLELKNSGAAAASLDGYYLSDDPSDPFKWAFPS